MNRNSIASRPGWLASVRSVSRWVSALAHPPRKKDEYVRTVAHELRVPLTSLRGSVSLLQSGAAGPMTPEAQRLLDVALRNADRMGRLIQDLVDVERLSSGAARLNLVSCNARQLAETAREVVSPIADARRVRVLLLGDACTLRADADRVVQVLTNLLSNAVKFSPPGSTVTLRTHRQNGDVLLEVEDRGRGIPAAELERIFEPFAQVALADEREMGGSGLGLAISRAIVKQHGGRIWATSGDGLTRFTAAFPAGQA